MHTVGPNGSVANRSYCASISSTPFGSVSLRCARLDSVCSRRSHSARSQTQTERDDRPAAERPAQRVERPQLGQPRPGPGARDFQCVLVRFDHSCRPGNDQPPAWIDPPLVLESGLRPSGRQRPGGSEAKWSCRDHSAPTRI
jgi:hypothetical protein